ncbi:AAA family ATPase [Citrobacter freundii]|uniref:AAA family ATPase n=1 Tax=Citrobacter sp. MGH105 TaxID=1686380 RepID=UPI00065253DB|nr:AAA family ATPase [Citrobacter sp. MGH105]QNM18192.1 AAA family ATPase [Citrobacter freundii]QNM23655.1 AAA family ATPase [Citrobacter freundii]QNM28345.1 AAA family ATPase [Citrobacter freundii]QNM33578.1 AAA family ATPase [Citrobacter freundii]
MKIAHIYIKKYKILNEINIPINAEHDCNFNHGCIEINKKEKDLVPEKYYDEISLSAVIGENGVGKSTLLEFIEASFSYVNGSGIIVWHDPDSGYLIHVYNMNVKQVNNTSQFPHEIYYLYETTLFKENVKVIKINNLPSPTGESKNKKSRHVKNIPLSKIEINTKDRFLRTYTYLLHNPRGNKLKGSQASFEFIFNHHNLNDIIELNNKYNIKRGNSNSYVVNKIDKIFSYKYESTNTIDEIIDQILDATCLSTLKSLVSGLKYESSELNMHLIELISSYLNNRSYGVENANQSFELCLKGLNKNSISEKLLENYIYGFRSLSYLLENKIIFKKNNIESIVIEDERITVKTESAEEAYRGVKHLDAIPRVIKHNISYGWKGFSSGEYALIKFFCELEAAVLKLQKKTKSFIFIIDEVDLYLHPEWQREFIDELIEHLASLRINMKSQVILTTHSPIIISDFLSENIVALNKNNSGQVEKISSSGFGTPISELYIDGMHLSSTFGSRSKRYIDDIIESRDNLDEFQKKLIEKIKSKNIRLMLGASQ